MLNGIPTQVLRKRQALRKRQVLKIGLAFAAGILALPCVAQQLANDALSVTVNAQEGSYQLSFYEAGHGGQPCLNPVWRHKLTTSGFARAITRVTKPPNLHSKMNSAPAGRHRHLRGTRRQTRSGLRRAALSTTPLRYRPGEGTKHHEKGSNGAGHPGRGGDR